MDFNSSTGNSRKDVRFENDKGVELRRSKSPKGYKNFKCLLPKESDKGKWSVKSLAWSRKEENNFSKKCINHSSSSMVLGLDYTDYKSWKISSREIKQAN